MDIAFVRAESSRLFAHAAVDSLYSSDRDMRRQLHQKDILLQEMQHRMSNSLQIVASILLMKARTVQSEEARLHLRDAHGRVMSIAAVQRRLQVSRSGDAVEIGLYLSDLCRSLEASLIGDMRPISLEVSTDPGAVASTDAVSIGLIVTELVINALKHAFGTDEGDCRIGVIFDVAEDGWRLAVHDNGCGKSSVAGEAPKFGLGTSLVEALARQLDARVAVASSTDGYKTTITHKGFV